MRLNTEEKQDCAGKIERPDFGGQRSRAFNYELGHLQRITVRRSRMR